MGRHQKLQELELHRPEPLSATTERRRSSSSTSWTLQTPPETAGATPSTTATSLLAGEEEHAGNLPCEHPTPSLSRPICFQRARLDLSYPFGLLDKTDGFSFT